MKQGNSLRSFDKYIHSNNHHPDGSVDHFHHTRWRMCFTLVNTPTHELLLTASMVVWPGVQPCSGHGDSTQRIMQLSMPYGAHRKCKGRTSKVK